MNRFAASTLWKRCLQALTSLFIGANLWVGPASALSEKHIEQRTKAVREAILSNPSAKSLLDLGGIKNSKAQVEVAQWGNWNNWNNWRNWNNWSNWANWRNF